jgi:hypothetical protein
MRQMVIDALQDLGLDTPEVESIVAKGLAENVRDWIVLSYAGKIARQLRGHRPNTTPRQGWLALPEYQDTPCECADDSLEQLKARIIRLERRIRDYDYARRAAEGLKRDKQQLRGLKKLEIRIAPFFAKDPAMTVTRAVLMYENALVKKARKAIRSRWRSNEKSTGYV